MSALKEWLNGAVAEQYADGLAKIDSTFDRQKFLDLIIPHLEPLELKERVALFAEAMYYTLPAADYQAAVAVLLALITRLDVRELALWPIPHYVEAYGLEHPDISLPALKQITLHMSAEFAIRPFIVRYPAQTMAVIHQWAEDDNEHVRRLASEGTRPRLPWGSRLYDFMKDPQPTLAILEKLKDDPSLYVRRSVANHLNDIGKDHPAVLAETAARWLQEASEERQWLVRHALRSLFKAGHPEALRLMGFERPQVTLTALTIIPEVIKMGETLTFGCTLQNELAEPQALMIDYVIHFVKANGQTRPKVFKLTQRTLAGEEAVTIEKNHTIKPITTRTYYAGTHQLEIQVNGQIVGGVSFELQL